MATMKINSVEYKNATIYFEKIKKMIEELIRNKTIGDKYNNIYNTILVHMKQLDSQIFLQGGKRRTHKKHNTANYKTRKNHKHRTSK